MDKDRTVLTPESGEREVGDANAAQIEDHALSADEVFRQQRGEQRAAAPVQLFIP
jgi:hypothetical protein